MPTARLTRTVTFRATHRYYRPDWSAARNTEVFGPCAAAPGHAHEYHCGLTVSGAVSPETGMAVDLRAVDALLRTEVLDRFENRHINEAVPEFAFGKIIPTGEALAVFVWSRIQPRLPADVRLLSVRIQEDETLFSEYHGDA